MDTNARKVFQKNFKRIMMAKKKTQSDISRTLNIPLSTVSSWYNGASYPRVDKMQSLADFFNVSMRDLTDDASDSSVYESAGLQYISVPLYNPICCGNGLFTEDEIINYVAVPADGLSRGLEYFAQVAKGDSMNGIGIEDGDLLVFQKTSSVDPGSIVPAPSKQ